MKKIKYIGLFFLFFSGSVNVFGQELLIEKMDDVDAIVRQLNLEVELTEKEALVIIKSICPFTFDSNVDKEVVILKKEQLDDWHYYALKLSVPSKARRLRLISDDYEAITHQLGDLQPAEIRGLSFWIDPFKKSLKEGMTSFDQGEYEQAKSKFLEASDIAIDPIDKKTVTDLLEKAILCIDAKAEAEQYYSKEQWCAAIAAYEKVIGANRSDTYCKEKHTVAHEKCMKSDRIITGVVTNTQGKKLAGVSIAIEIAQTDKKGNIKYSFSPKITETNAAGEFQVKVLRQTRKLQYWLFKFKKYEIGITGDVVNIVINDGTDGSPFGSTEQK